jgi:hypothetical protein
MIAYGMPWTRNTDLLYNYVSPIFSVAGPVINRPTRATRANTQPQLQYNFPVEYDPLELIVWDSD